MKNLHLGKKDKQSLIDALIAIFLFLGLIGIVQKLAWPVVTDVIFLVGVISFILIFFVLRILIRRVYRLFLVHRIFAALLGSMVLMYGAWINTPEHWRSQIVQIWDTVLGWLPILIIAVVVGILLFVRNKLK